ncbi:MAG TPA: Mor transcription activator family protein [Cellvibrio sp.]|nr:Mor transcription activator family protein [Cellvibrio sp.]
MSNDSRMAHLRNELLTDVCDQIAKVLLEFNIEPAKAEHAGSHVANFLAEHWGGQLITFPKDHLHKITQRDLEIFEKVTAANITEIAKEYGLTVNGIYRVIRRIRTRAISEKQPNLF